MTLLEQIIEQKKRESSGLGSTLKNARPTKSRRSLFQALKKKGPKPNLIAEIKKASPSKGTIFPGADVFEIAEIYEQNGAAAVSVLTDTEWFHGSLADLHSTARTVEIPVLRKDFIIDPNQILEARLSGADAILLMVCVIPEVARLKELMDYAATLGLDCLVETKNEAEIKTAVAAGATIIGVNARSFADLSVDTSVFATLLPLIPDNCIKVAESGIQSVAELEAIAPLADAVLMGTHFMATQDYEQIAQLTTQITS